MMLQVFVGEIGYTCSVVRTSGCKILFTTFAHLTSTVSRGHGHGVSAKTERFVRAARGFPEGIVEAWANLYTEFAMAVAARKDGRKIPADWLDMPYVDDGRNGVAFIDATVRSNEVQGAWVKLE